MACEDGLPNGGVGERKGRVEGVNTPLVLGLLVCTPLPNPLALEVKVGTSVTAGSAVMQGEEQLLVDPEGLRVRVESTVFVPPTPLPPPLVPLGPKGVGVSMAL